MLRDLAEVTGKKDRDRMVKMLRKEARGVYKEAMAQAMMVSSIPGTLFMFMFLDVLNAAGVKTALFKWSDYQSALPTLEKLVLYPLVLTEEDGEKKIIPAAMTKDPNDQPLDSKIAMAIKLRPNFLQEVWLEAWTPDDTGVPLHVILNLTKPPALIYGNDEDGGIWTKYDNTQAEKLWPKLVTIKPMHDCSAGVYALVKPAAVEGRPS